MNLRR